MPDRLSQSLKFYHIFMQFLNEKYNNDLYIEDHIIQNVKPISFKKEGIKYLVLTASYSMNGLFAGCSSLQNLPDISKWNMKNTKDISFMFAGCHL